ncbi:hypothetical protein BDZ97DRAFT_1762795 [Flammula alnicola]|nr:hypothetical protein BDZ97DRAFT_1762795 [Flammula alnicola]
MNRSEQTAMRGYMARLFENQDGCAQVHLSIILGRNGHDIDASRNLTTPEGPERQQLRTRQALRDRFLNVEESPRRRSAAPRPKTPTPQPGHVERTRARVRALNREARTAELLSSPRRKRVQVASQDENNPQGTNARVLLARYLPSSTPPRLNGESSQPNVPARAAPRDHQTPTVGNAAQQRHSRSTSQRERREHERLARIQQASSPAANTAPQPWRIARMPPLQVLSPPPTQPAPAPTQDLWRTLIAIPNARSLGQQRRREREQEERSRIEQAQEPRPRTNQQQNQVPLPTPPATQAADTNDRGYAEDDQPQAEPGHDENMVNGAMPRNYETLSGQADNQSVQQMLFSTLLHDQLRSEEDREDYF